MKLIVREVDYTNNVFFAVVDGIKTGFYLSNKLAQLFIFNIEPGYLVDFEINDQIKKINNYTCYQVNHFLLIRNLKVNRDLYNHKLLQKEMMKFLKNQNNVLFLDLEMTIAAYGQKRYQPEIIQYGFLLVNKDGETILTGDNYLLTKDNKGITYRTFKFLKIDQKIYYEKALNYNIFYNEFKNIIETYNPKIVVWGTNDIRTLNYSYELHKLKSLTDDNSFIDLLKLHKNFYNLKNDLGLFNAYNEYYDLDLDQKHHAKEDAKITKKIYEAFIFYGNDLLKK